MSANGQYMIVAAKRNLNYSGHKFSGLYMSYDYGTTWDRVVDAVEREWLGLAMSPDGSHIIAGIGDAGTGSPSGYLYSSTDYGVTWIEENTQTDMLDWQNLGTYYTAAVANSYILTSASVMSSGQISPSSSYMLSGQLLECSRSDIPSLVLKTNNGLLSGNYTFVVHNIRESEAWNFYLEGVHDMSNGVPSEYILYTFNLGSCNQYHFYKGSFVVEIGVNDLYSFNQPLYLWGQSVSGSFTTGRIPVYPRKLN
jgi:hypothetical protein